MAVPGRADVPDGAPEELAQTELFAVDAYRQAFDASVVDTDPDQRRIKLSRTAFFPGGGGQPHDTGTLRTTDGVRDVVRVKRDGGGIWHWLEGDEDLPAVGNEVEGVLDWERRHTVMRTHTALHILCGVIWEEFKTPV